MMPALAMTGAENLIDGCLGPISGMTIGLVAEKPELGWYDAAIADTLEECITARGGICRRLASDGPANMADPRITTLEAEVDGLVFLCRSGDQGRFERKAATKPVVMCYARNAAMLASEFGTLPHGAMTILKKLIDRLCMEAREIEVTCPAGTCLTGSITPPPDADDKIAEVGIKRFPMAVPQPLGCEGFSGRVVIRGSLATTGSRVYYPPVVALDDEITVTLDGNRITSVDGDPADQARFRKHYMQIAEQFGLDAYFVHSFHAGIHPGLDPAMVSMADADYWANTVFGSPHFLHFHTCGMTPPGEICWMIADPTIRLDGVALWLQGKLQPMAFVPLASMLEESAALQAAFQRQPATAWPPDDIQGGRQA